MGPHSTSYWLYTRRKLWFWKMSLSLSLPTFSYTLLILFLSLSNSFKCALFSEGKSIFPCMTCKAGTSFFPYSWATASCPSHLFPGYYCLRSTTVTHTSGLFHPFICCLTAPIIKNVLSPLSPKKPWPTSWSSNSPSIEVPYLSPSESSLPVSLQYPRFLFRQFMPSYFKSLLKV